ncbi:MAG: hypothetical protein KDB27_20370, partial [Planctomycetales bacterium]|nr:hypothetical protein [Planctomycetales bacterium]
RGTEDTEKMSQRGSVSSVALCFYSEAVLLGNSTAFLIGYKSYLITQATEIHHNAVRLVERRTVTAYYDDQALTQMETVTCPRTIQPLRLVHRWSVDSC